MFKFPAASRPIPSPLASPDLTPLDISAMPVAHFDFAVCNVGADDPFDELARLINGGPVETPTPSAEPTPANEMPRIGEPVMSPVPVAALSEPVLEPSAAATEEPDVGPVMDLSVLRAAFEPAAQSPEEPANDLAREMRGIARQERTVEPAPAMQSSSDVPPPQPPAHGPLAQFDEQLASMLGAPEAPAAPVPADPIVARPTPNAVPSTPPAPATFDANAFAAPRVPETEVPLVVGQATPGMADLEQALGHELEAALEADLSASLAASAPSDVSPAEPRITDAPSVPQLGAMGIPAALMAAAAEREIAPAEPVAVCAPEVGAHRRERSGRHHTLAASIAALAIFGASASVAWMLIGPDADAEAPIVLASTQAVKVKPADAGGVTIPNQDTALFKDGGQRTSHQTALKRGSEAPVEVAKVRPVRIDTSGRKREGMQAKRVRTVVVKPDGTIISADGGSDPQIVGSVPSRVRKVEPVRSVAAPQKVAVEPAARKVKAQPVTPAGPAVTASAPASAAEPITAKPVPEKPVEVATAPPAQSVEAAPKPPHDGYVVQISSRRSEEVARKTFSQLQKRYSSVLGSREAEYQRKEIDGKGTFYRVRVLAESKRDASNLCRQLKRAGGACFVSR